MSDSSHGYARQPQANPAPRAQPQLQTSMSLQPHFVRWSVPVAGVIGLAVGAFLSWPIAVGAFVAAMCLAHLATWLWEPVLAAPFRAADSALTLPAGIDRKVVIVLVTSALCITGLEYFGMSNRHVHVVSALQFMGFDSAAVALDEAMRDQISRLTWWALGCVITYFVIPAFVVVFVLKESLRDYGFRIRGALDDWWIYAIFLAVMLPTVLIVSGDAHFQDTYPFYRMSPGESWWPNMMRWQLLYWLQFLTLEFFFRGFMVHGTKHRLGSLSVFVMMVPYCMIHFGKPLPETLGAIIAGVVLGALSLKTRSIWLGVAIHVSVAVSMDLASLWRAGLLGP
ncbi:MAG: hypothetical protein ACI81R_001957 [Bradymonadia bacterium]